MLRKVLEQRDIIIELKRSGVFYDWNMKDDRFQEKLLVRASFLGFVR